MSTPEQGAPDCGAHPRISAELRAMAELFAARLQPWLERMAREGVLGRDPGQDVPGQDPGPGPAEGDSPCTRCPLCALLAALRGDRPDVVARLAEHAAGLTTAVRDLVTPPAERAGDKGHAASERSGRDRSRRVAVQHIVVRAAARDEGGAPGC